MREVAYDKLSDFVNDFDHHQAGEHFTITDVPADKIKKHESATGFPDLYYLQSSDDDSDVATGFVTAYMLIKSLAANKTSEPAKLRATAVLIEVKGEFDVYRTSFITKIEGLNDDGSVMWTANGAEPPKVKFKN